MTTTRFENDVFFSNVGAWDDTRTANEGSTDVGQDISVQVSTNDDIKLLRLGDELHSSVIDNHVRKLDSAGFVLLGDLSAGVQEETIALLHNIGLVDSSDLLATILEGEIKRKASNALRLCLGDDL